MKLLATRALQSEDCTHRLDGHEIRTLPIAYKNGLRVQVQSGTFFIKTEVCSKTFKTKALSAVAYTP